MKEALIIVGFSILAALVIVAFCVLCYRLLFTRNLDDYPIKYNAKIKTKIPPSGPTHPDVSCNQLASLEDWQEGNR